MTHDISPQNIAASQASTQVPVYFVKLVLDSGDVLVHTQLGVITWGGNDYQGVGNLGTIQAVSEESEIGRATTSLTLSGIDSALISIVLGQYYQGRAAYIYIGFLDETTRELVSDPMLLFAGNIDTAPIELGAKTGSITMTVENEFADWDKPRVRRYNTADQQSRFPGDNFFKFAEQAADAQVYWGRANAG